jgi:hypothetical protein
MNRRNFTLGALSLGALLALTACSTVEKSRYKMTVEVETPQGLKTGFAVREIRHSTPANLPSIGESRPQWTVRGEAVAVDLPEAQTMFALLTGADGEVDFGGRDIDFMFKELGPASPDGVIELWPHIPVTKRPIIAHPLPLLVRFGDVRDPKSVAKVDPDHLDASFGSGVTLRRITLQLTDDPMTSGIEKRLATMGIEPPDHGLDRATGVTFSPTLAQQLSYLDFRR